MMLLGLNKRNAGGLALPALLLLCLGTVITLQTQTIDFQFGSSSSSDVAAPDIVTLMPAAFDFRPGGQYQQGGVAVSSPIQTITLATPLDIMRYQVSAADYGRCVAAAACPAARPRHTGTGNIPVAGVSFNNATTYAAWLSHNTGDLWRLPTLEEWDFAADGLAGDHEGQFAA